jgi:sialate O-acetylesterase
MRIQLFRTICLLLLSQLIFCFSAKADIKLHALIADHMVLQQKSKCLLWGEASPNEKIEVTAGFIKSTLTTIADAHGNWSVQVKTPSAGGPFEIIFKGNNEVKVSDVYLGEVWIASGQSNMEFAVDSLSKGYSGVLDYKKEIASSNYQMIRQFIVKRKVSREPALNIEGKWQVCTPQSAGKFSAVAYYFSKNLYQKLNVPVAIINDSWGGTVIHGWMSAEDLQGIGVYDEKLKTILDESKKFDQYYPSAIHNGMIAPVKNYSIKGFLWYQGESDINDIPPYSQKMQRFITGLRTSFGKPDMPFLFVQIAPCDYNIYSSWFHGNDYSLGYLWEQQVATLALKNTAMARTGDIGDTKNIHPRNKQEVGRRLALLALADVYKKQNGQVNGPSFKSLKINGKKVSISFRNIGSGLNVKGQELSGFELAGEDQQFFSATAKLENNSVELTSSNVKSPVSVRYGFKNDHVINLFNSAGFPAVSFRAGK